eukprot:GHVQ01033239.1.p2 GENE.GHVQ01033239.1~~GHVQ01033239.1.p2  ORF type:complete len:406 (-),score=52.49 GHVQ01033239.1:3608-4825(-)
MCVVHCFREAWLKRLTAVEVFEGDLQSVIMNYLTVHGYEKAAEAFSNEAETQPEMPVGCIGPRKRIREAVLGGDIETAISLINQIDSKILDDNPELSFRLKQQQLQQLIEKGDTSAVIEFAQQQLAPCVKMHPDLLPELERSMSLLFFNDLSSKGAQKLVGGVDQREGAANIIDDVILDFFNIEKVSRIEMMVKNLIWSQTQVQESSTKFMDASDNRARTSGSNDNQSSSEVIGNTVSQFPGVSFPLKLTPDGYRSLCPLMADILTGSITSAVVPPSCALSHSARHRSSARRRANSATLPLATPGSTAEHSAPGSSSATMSGGRRSLLAESSSETTSLLSSSQSSRSAGASASASPSSAYPTSSWGFGSLPQNLIIVQASSADTITASSATSSSSGSHDASRRSS